MTWLSVRTLDSTQEIPANPVTGSLPIHIPPLIYVVIVPVHHEDLITEWTGVFKTDKCRTKG